MRVPACPGGQEQGAGSGVWGTVARGTCAHASCHGSRRKEGEGGDFLLRKNKK